MAKPKYSSAVEMQQIIDAYFEDCAGTLLTDKRGQPVLDRRGYPVIVGNRPPTVTGLAAALGFRTRKSLCDYRRKGDFAQVITTARLRVENYAEMRLFDADGARGAMFTLGVNFGWGKENRNKPKKIGSIVNVVDTAPGQCE